MKRCEVCKRRGPAGHVRITFFADEDAPIGFSLCRDCLGEVRRALEPALEEA